MDLVFRKRQPRKRVKMLSQVFARLRRVKGEVKIPAFKTGGAEKVQREVGGKGKN